MNKWKELRFEKYIFGILLAIEVIMSFTFLGYIHVPPISISIAYIPIVVSACLLGVRESTIAGLVFGLGSMYKASAAYVMSDDMIFSPFQTDQKFGSLMLSVGARVAFGILIGLVFMLVKRAKHPLGWKALAALIAPKTHAFLVYSAMGIWFPDRGFNYKSIFQLNFNACMLALFCCFCVLVTDRILNSDWVRQYREAINASVDTPYWSYKIGVQLAVVGVLIFGMAVFSTVYFADRAQFMLHAHGVEASDVVYKDILHLQIQCLFSMLALDFILLLIILMVYRYAKYREYRGELDGLTGIMGRRLFLHYCNQIQINSEQRHGKHGWFLFIDVDWFKQINDTLGHPVGDNVLKQVARHLQSVFSSDGAVGRMGGDEFAVMIAHEMNKKELERRLKRFLEEIGGILSDRTVSCSIGAYRFTFPCDAIELLTETDHVLYRAKEKGRACFVVKENNG